MDPEGNVFFVFDQTALSFPEAGLRWVSSSRASYHSQGTWSFFGLVHPTTRFFPSTWSPHSHSSTPLSPSETWFFFKAPWDHQANQGLWLGRNWIGHQQEGLLQAKASVSAHRYLLPGLSLLLLWSLQLKKKKLIFKGSSQIWSYDFITI